MMVLHHVLGVTIDATEEEIYAAFKQKARVLHPDAGGSAEAFAQLTEAYSTLKDENKRKLHEQQLRSNVFPCMECDGTGARYVQRGFQKVRMGNCKACDGVGYPKEG